MKTFAGIDYSITSPAICIHYGDLEFSIKNCKFLFLTKTKKFSGFDWRKGRCPLSIQGKSHSTSKKSMKRFTWIANEFIRFIIENDTDRDGIGIEDYSFGSRGKVFNIAENTGILKYKLLKNAYGYSLYAPKSIKKFAVGNGNATKEMMVDKFIEETKIDLMGILGTKNKKSSPLTDLVDAYFICKYHNSIKP